MVTMRGLMRKNRCLSLGAALLLSAPVLADPDIQLNAILGKKVIVTVNGEQYTLREGEQAIKGLVFVESRGKTAVFEWEGKQTELSPSSRIATQFDERPPETITIYRDASLHYLIGGEINGRRVDFIVDTGATVVALNAQQANTLGLSWKQNPPQAVATAGGMTQAHFLLLDQVTVGGITVRQVEAVVVPSQSTPILLGMTFLRHFEMSEVDNTLTLKKKF